MEVFILHFVFLVGVFVIAFFIVVTLDDLLNEDKSLISITVSILVVLYLLFLYFAYINSHKEKLNRLVRYCIENNLTIPYEYKEELKEVLAHKLDKDAEKHLKKK